MSRMQKGAALAIAFSFFLAASFYWISPVLTKKLDASVRADKVVVLKGRREMMLMRNGHVLKTYKISLGKDPKGPKTRAEDGRTPEGNYVLDWRNPHSKFHLSLHISYPNAADRQNAQRLGVSPGDDIMVHGLQNGLGWIGPFHRFWDWTDGCIAVTDPEIDEIWRAVPDGTPIEIRS